MKGSFIRFLLRVLKDIKYQEIIAWNQKNSCFAILNSEKFEEKVLSQNFHNINMEKFEYELASYGFKRMIQTQIPTYTHKFLNSIKNFRKIQKKIQNYQSLNSGFIEKIESKEQISVDKNKCILQRLPFKVYQIIDTKKGLDQFFSCNRPTSAIQSDTPNCRKPNEKIFNDICLGNQKTIRIKRVQ